jgi:hypothetical protein
MGPLCLLAERAGALSFLLSRLRHTFGAFRRWLRGAVAAAVTRALNFTPFAAAMARTPWAVAGVALLRAALGLTGLDAAAGALSGLLAHFRTH